MEFKDRCVKMALKANTSTALMVLLFNLIWWKMLQNYVAYRVVRPIFLKGDSYGSTAFVIG